MIVLDTTVLLYAKGGDHPLRAPCWRLIEGARRRQLTATTTIEVIQEFAYARARRYGRRDATDLARDYATGLSPLLLIEESDLHDGLHLYETHVRLGSFDAVLAAATRSLDAILVSTDRAFADVPGLRHVFPDDEGVDSLLKRS